MDGLLLVNKPKGISSHEVVKKIRHFTGGKVGHTGTLDPVATGLLIICVGKATKLTPFLQEVDKTYLGRVVFGITTSTFDEEGEITEKKDASSLTQKKVQAIFNQFQGKISQTPPAYSAVRSQGKRLYKLARKGKKVSPSPREVYIYSLKMLRFLEAQHPEVDFEVRCSKGTYIRSLCYDIGRESGYGGYQFLLCRTKVGNFSLEEATPLQDIEQMIEEKRENEVFLTLSEALPHFPKVLAKKGVEKFIKWGRPLYFSHFSHIPPDLEKGDRVRICSQENHLLAVGMSLQNGSHFTKDKVGFKYLRVLA